ncbi:hypothetical protein COOONC_20520 [Cooperia oncophora]
MTKFTNTWNISQENRFRQRRHFPNVTLLGDNYSVAMRRLEFLQKACKFPEQRQWYSNNRKMLGRGCRADMLLYSLLRYRPQKKVPLKVVLNASSKRKNKLALNDVIQSLINNIHGILISSRKQSIHVACGIEADFSQIRLIDSHNGRAVTASPTILNMALASYLLTKLRPWLEKLLATYAWII